MTGKVTNLCELTSVFCSIKVRVKGAVRVLYITQPILNDVPEHVIMAHTGHKKSDTLKKYIRQTNKWKDNAATKLGL